MAREMEGLSNRRDGGSSLELSPSVVYIEACENYQKQSYRNRCRILAGDGVQVLSFPIVHEGGTHKIPISTIKVDYSKPWIQQHQKAILSAYGTSAYFEYYYDELFQIMNSKPDTLFALNMEITKFFIEKTGICAEINTTEEFSPEGSYSQIAGCYDYRERIHPKRANDILQTLGLDRPYFQVFSQRHGFQTDLSIMDLLFNEGPDSILYLKSI